MKKYIYLFPVLFLFSCSSFNKSHNRQLASKNGFCSDQALNVALGIVSGIKQPIDSRYSHQVKLVDNTQESHDLSGGVGIKEVYEIELNHHRVTTIEYKNIIVVELLSYEVQGGSCSFISASIKNASSEAQ